MTFYVGQKVVCVEMGPNTPAANDMKRLTIGAVYTVRATAINPRCGRQALHLEEVINEIWDTELDGIGEPYYGAYRFRPLVEKKTDISVFTRLLNPQHHKPLITSDA